MSLIVIAQLFVVLGRALKSEWRRRVTCQSLVALVQLSLSRAIRVARAPLLNGDPRECYENAARRQH